MCGGGGGIYMHAYTCVYINIRVWPYPNFFLVFIVFLQKQNNINVTVAHLQRQHLRTDNRPVSVGQIRHHVGLAVTRLGTQVKRRIV